MLGCIRIVHEVYVVRCIGGHVAPNVRSTYCAQFMGVRIVHSFNKVEENGRSISVSE